MKTMTCKQLGGVCDLEFHANSFEEMGELSRQHGLDMYQKGDQAHITAMNEMGKMMRDPDGMREWYEKKRAEFAALTEDE